MDPRLQTELNRFKEIQKNPQLLLQTLLHMENERQRQIEDLREKNNNDTRCNENSLVCYICGYLFHRTIMYAHLKSHNVRRTYACAIEQCNSVYKSKQGLTRHQLVHHLKRTSVNGKDKPFRRRRRISAADQVENGKRSHICKVCGKCFPRKSTFLVHLRIHTEEKPERYRLCYRADSLKAALRSHSKTCLHAVTFPMGPK